jgi:hypothetical protein
MGPRALAETTAMPEVAAWLVDDPDAQRYHVTNQPKPKRPADSRSSEGTTKDDPGIKEDESGRSANTTESSSRRPTPSNPSL